MRWPSGTDWIGGIALLATIYALTFIAGVLS
jgi:hypothetical protein